MTTSGDLSIGDPSIDSVLLIGFGGPTRSEEIMPFLENVVRGRGIPEARLKSVEQHYLEVGGRSPYNELSEKQRSALAAWLERHRHPLPVYLGMRNWHPYLAETIATMNEEERENSIGIILASHRTQVSRERYVEDVDKAVSELGLGKPTFQYLNAWFDDPRFHEAVAQRIEEDSRHRRGAWPGNLPVLFTAHSVPRAMAEDSPYVSDLEISCAAVATLLGVSDWQLAYQSRSGDPGTPWLEPDINRVLEERAEAGTREVVIAAIGFLCDHVEVLYDLDIEARATCKRLGITLHRAACVNDHVEFISLLGERVLRAAGQPV